MLTGSAQMAYREILEYFAVGYTRVIYVSFYVVHIDCMLRVSLCCQ